MILATLPANRPTVSHYTLKLVLCRYHTYSYIYLLELQVGQNFFQGPDPPYRSTSSTFVFRLDIATTLPYLFLYILIRTTTGFILLPSTSSSLSSLDFIDLHFDCIEPLCELWERTSRSGSVRGAVSRRKSRVTDSSKMLGTRYQLDPYCKGKPLRC
jgi:hypothetical protein